MLLKLYPDNPNYKEFRKIAEILRDGGVIIYPTDTVYAIGCDINNNKAIQKIAKLKGVSAEKANFSIICNNLSNLSEYAKVDNGIFKMMKKNLPGAFTFILPASSNLPKLFKSKKKNVGIRVPDHFIPLGIVEELGNPIMTTSIHDPDDVVEYTTDPELIHEKYQKDVDLVIDGSFGRNVASTIIDCTNGEFEVVREGIGELIL
ncbi:tRNA threonylcarbamoyl adenosine modification protein (Sua5/YciO/YrdC/YwlC family) [Ancylomarina subtilis]|uniref:tRNA threonylcarbamoyl adenosine modification protein (Sua5/YciO/YrdC/YwlC family) n=1 Tax=Ancylomarina subtilis TaxID=1639035 RepID=A0A4Q7V9W4_9BACT|nr:L-threonylcarbamoyladenylate synthase [Ancylomarina subtilis]RZT93305.1 tRNA threonylcarbamoyl adenosine modification protein (Sua5/YciO/YrdC/YwlC family) [Ancylomarina subtilis]